MHIPQSTTKDIEVLTFSEAMKKSNKKPLYDTKKWIYIPNFYSDYRYILGTNGENPLICIGINPSTATPDMLDNTLKSVNRIALANGFDSFIMFNIYAERATNPNDVEVGMNTFLHNENMKAFEYILKLSKNNKSSIWAAWGTIIEKRSYFKNCLKDIVDIANKHNVHWYMAGKCSKSGHPHHPLYLKKDEKLLDFDIKTYMNI